VQISTAYGQEQKGSATLPRNRYTEIRAEKPTTKEAAIRPEFKTCKYISEAIVSEGIDKSELRKAKRAELMGLSSDGAEPEDPDEYRAENIFWVPKEGRWSVLKDNAPQPTIGKLVDDAMTAIERDNPSLQGVLPKDYARPGLDKQRLGQLINLVSNIALGSPVDRSKDMLGRVYEYFLSQFASAEGKKGGQFYTPAYVVRVLVEMLAPYKGRVYDPCCGSGGMFVQSEKFIEVHSGRIGDISIYERESNYTTWRLAKMNLAIRGIDAQIGHGDTFHNDRHPDLKADYVIANPPFNDSDWRGDLLKTDKRWVLWCSAGRQATTSGDDVVVHLRDASTAGAELPESLVRYVVRTQKNVILEDALSGNSFSADPYVVQHRARSILCLPLINQAKLIGVLYLENNLTPHVFTTDRITVLKVLASQAAVSPDFTGISET
jgi:hypothetical protein